MKEGLLEIFADAGCVVSKGQYEAQLIRTQQFEARVADLEARLAAAGEQRRSLEESLEESRVEVEKSERQFRVTLRMPCAS